MGEDAYRMEIGGMTCAHCDQSVSEALEEAGALDVQANFRRGEAIFKLPALMGDPKGLVDAVRDAGYQPGAITTIIPIDNTRKEISTREQGSASPASTAEHVRESYPEAEYDMAVIGSGGAAMAAAITGVEAGARVVMIERGTIGGTCVNIGCVPSKTLLRASEIYHQAAHHPFNGVETSEGKVDLASLIAQKDELVAQMRQEKYEGLIEEYGWDLIQGEAHFVDEQTLAVGDRHIKASTYLIATGADPAIPPIPGLPEAGYLTSTEALALTELPETLFVIGAGYIALELGQLFSRLGTRVALVQRGPRLLEEYEPEIGELMQDVLTHQGIEVIAGAQVERVERADKERNGKRKVHLTVKGKNQVHEVDQVLVATGRRPNTEALNLRVAGIEIDERGAVVVDEQLRTTNPRVWAAGDVTLAPQFVYVASYEGKLAAENALKGADRAVDFTALPAVIFTSPQVAVVGLTEQEARAQGHSVKSSVLPLDIVPRAQVNHDTVGLVKMVAEEGSNRILGVHMVGESAGDVIYAGTLAVKYGLTVEELVDSFAPYLTMAESLKLAAQSFDRDVHKLSCCAA